MLPPIIVSDLKDYLEILQDKEEQIRIWTGRTEFALDYVETMCGIFTDTGFTILVEEGRAESFFGAELVVLLSRIDELTASIDPYDDPTKIANLPEMDEIRGLAAEALTKPLFKIGS